MKSPLFRTPVYIAALGMMACSLPLTADTLTVEGDLNVEGNIGGSAVSTTSAANKIPKLDANGKLDPEMVPMDGVTSAIQTQLNAKVSGPASVAENSIAVFNGTTGKLIKPDYKTATLYDGFFYMDDTSAGYSFVALGSSGGRISSGRDGNVVILEPEALQFYDSEENYAFLVPGALNFQTVTLPSTTGTLLNDADASVTSSPGKIVKLDENGKLDPDMISMEGVTSAIQAQIDAKAPLASPTFTGTVTASSIQSPILNLNGTSVTKIGQENLGSSIEIGNLSPGGSSTYLYGTNILIGPLMGTMTEGGTTMVWFEDADTNAIISVDYTGVTMDIGATIRGGLTVDSISGGAVSTTSAANKIVKLDANGKLDPGMIPADLAPSSLTTTIVTADTIVLSARAGDISMGIYGNPE